MRCGLSIFLPLIARNLALIRRAWLEILYIAGKLVFREQALIDNVLRLRRNSFFFFDFNHLAKRSLIWFN